MDSVEDIALLRAYTEQGSEPAFAELVQRRIGLVYSVALRQVGGDAHLAEDVTQHVFTALARQASSLMHRPAIGGWLYRAAHYTAVDVVRSERRRHVREQRCELMPEQPAHPDTPADWERVRPLLDDALSALGDRDRDAVALRFFEGRTFADIGSALRLTEDAARKRVDRALEKMAVTLQQHGITSASAGLAVALAGQVALAAPKGLATTVTSTALAGAVVAGSGLWSFLGSAKTSLALASVAVAAAVVTLHQFQKANETAALLESARQQHDDLRTQMNKAQLQVQLAERRAQAAEDDTARLLAAIEAERVNREAAALAAKQSTVPQSTAPAPEKKELAETEPQIRVRLIQLSRKNSETDVQLTTQASMILARLQGGEAFADLAREFSSDLKKNKGGDWGWMKPSDFKPHFRDIAFSLDKGQVSAPLIIPEGCFILYAEDRR